MGGPVHYKACLSSSYHPTQPPTQSLLSGLLRSSPFRDHLVQSCLPPLTSQFLIELSVTHIDQCNLAAINWTIKQIEKPFAIKSSASNSIPIEQSFPQTSKSRLFLGIKHRHRRNVTRHQSFSLL